MVPHKLVNQNLSRNKKRHKVEYLCGGVPDKYINMHMKGIVCQLSIKTDVLLNFWLIISDRIKFLAPMLFVY